MRGGKGGQDNRLREPLRASPRRLQEAPTSISTCGHEPETQDRKQVGRQEQADKRQNPSQHIDPDATPMHVLRGNDCPGQRRDRCQKMPRTARIQAIIPGTMPVPVLL